MEPIRKCFEIKAATAALDDNCIKGPANVMGILDRGFDVVFPGFFKKALPAFLKNGFVSDAHDYSRFKDLPAYPTKAIERGSELYTEAVFHSTPAGQEARTVAKERKDAGLSVGLSVGFLPDYQTGVMRFRCGADLIEYAEEIGCNLSLFDVKGIKAHKAACRGLLPGGCKELYEYGIVPVPMNQASNATEVKALTPDEKAQDISSTETTESAETKNYYDESTYDPFEDIEEDLTLNALDGLYWALRVCQYRCVRAEETPLADRIATLQAQYDTFRDKSITIVEALMALGEDEKAAVLAEVKSFVETGKPGTDAPEPAVVDQPEEKDSVGQRISAAVKTFDNPRAFEDWLRDEVGLSNKQAVALASGYFKAGGEQEKTAEELQSDSASGEAENDNSEAERAEKLHALTRRHMALKEYHLRQSMDA